MTAPPELVGLAVFTLLWVPLWWLAGGRRPLTWLGIAAVAAATMVIAVARGDILCGIGSLVWAYTAARRWHNPRRDDSDRGSKQTLAEMAAATESFPAPGDPPTLNLLETCHGPGGPPISALRLRRRRRP